MMRRRQDRVSVDIRSLNGEVGGPPSPQNHIVLGPLETLKCARQQHRVARDARRVAHQPRVKSNDWPALVLGAWHCFSERAGFADDLPVAGACTAQRRCDTRSTDPGRATATGCAAPGSARPSWPCCDPMADWW